MVEHIRSTGQHDPSNLFVVVVFGHGPSPWVWKNKFGKVENVPGTSLLRRMRVDPPELGTLPES